MEYKIKEQTNKKKHRYRQQIGGYQRRKELEGRAKWVNEIKYMMMAGN